MDNLQVKISLVNEDAILPKYSTDGAAGLDCTARTKTYDEATKTWSYNLGFKIAIPEGYVGLLFPRSSVYKTGLDMCNCVGVIDSDYRGEVSAKFYIFNGEHEYNVGERCAQLIIIPYPKIKLIEVNELNKTIRGENGYGHTGL